MSADSFYDPCHRIVKQGRNALQRATADCLLYDVLSSIAMPTSCTRAHTRASESPPSYSRARNASCTSLAGPSVAWSRAPLGPQACGKRAEGGGTGERGECSVWKCRQVAVAGTARTVVRARLRVKGVCELWLRRAKKERAREKFSVWRKKQKSDRRTSKFCILGGLSRRKCNKVENWASW